MRTSDADQKLVRSYEEVRKQLLQLGLAHNPLLSFNPAGAKVMGMLWSEPQKLFERLVLQQKELIFRPARSDDEDSSGTKRRGRRGRPAAGASGAGASDAGAVVDADGRGATAEVGADDSPSQPQLSSLQHLSTEPVGQASGNLYSRDWNWARLQERRDASAAGLERLSEAGVGPATELSTRTGQDWSAALQEGAPAWQASPRPVKPAKESEPQKGPEMAPGQVPEWARNAKDELFADASESKLDRFLVRMHVDAQTFLSEQGFNALYLVVGFLEWYESDSSSKLRLAPLLLIPVELRRKNASIPFALFYSGHDVARNENLKEKLAAEFHVSLPELPDAIEDLRIEAYFDAVEKEVSRHKRWRVRREMVQLGLLQTARTIMYKDLDLAAWPAGNEPIGHPLVRALLSEGFPPSEPIIPRDKQLDDVLQPESVHHVVDADSTQIEAILAVRSGRHLLVQGPPGTGKSQTITNVIAELVSEGKTVLFVAEKMAALEVVKSRLDRLGIGAIALELHSNKAKKSQILAELRRTREAESPRASRVREQFDRLRDRTRSLNAYSAAMNKEIGESGRTIRHVMGRMLQIRTPYKQLPALALRVQTPKMASWSRAELGRAATAARELDEIIRVRIGAPRQHPFANCRLSEPPSQASLQQLAEWIDWTQAQIEAARRAGEAIAESLSREQPRTVGDLAKLVQLAKDVCALPDLRGIDFNDPRWRLEAPVVAELLEAGERLVEIRKRHEADLVDAIWDSDLTPLRANLAQLQGKTVSGWAISGARRQARKEVQAYWRTELPEKMDGALAVVDEVLDAQKLKRQLDEDRDLLASLLGSNWRELRSDWGALRLLVGWYRGVLERAPQRISELVALSRRSSQDRGALKAAADRLQEALGQISRFLPGICYQLRASGFERERLTETLATTEVETLRAMLAGWRPNLSRLHDWARLNTRLVELRERGLESLVDHVYELDDSTIPLELVIEYAVCLALEARAKRENPRLFATFDGGTHERAIHEFRELDRQLLEINRVRVAVAHDGRFLKSGGLGEWGVLLKEFQKKRRHLPLRKLMAEAGGAIQKLKPVFMMSPLSVANFLPQGAVHFNVVIFDEASQVRPADALGAIARADQLVVVGDTRQLPPTTFFEKAFEEEADVDADESVTAGLESVLNLCASRGMPEAMLRWHYRSRHQSLISVSNREFYDNRLMIFASPDAQRDPCGLILRHQPQTCYLRGKSSTNPEEARIVAERAIAFAQEVVRSKFKTPIRTLGIATFSQGQCYAVLEMLEQMRREHPGLERFFSGDHDEPFFVKNLENIQGDERDAIFVSVGYGKDEAGRLAMNFGPVNRDGGERRLNVIFTRARYRCEIFSNFTAADMSLGGTQSRGVKTLKHYLHFAEHGNFSEAEALGGFDSPFEEWVYDALVKRGYTVHTQVGVGSYRVDMAIVDPESPGRYILGIECDGAMYHSARTARDRDRLRQQVLEGLGWTIHRIWSTDWFEHPARELQAVDTQIAQLIARRKEHEAELAAQQAAEEEAAKRTAENPAPQEDEQSTGDEAEGATREGASAQDEAEGATREGARAQGETELDFDLDDDDDLDGVSLDQLDDAQDGTDKSARKKRGRPRGSRTQAGAERVSAQRPVVLADAQPYRSAKLDVPVMKTIDNVAEEELARWFTEIVEAEAPIHVDFAFARIAEALGARLGKNIRRKIAGGLARSLRAKRFERRGDFLWRRDDSSVVVRDRSVLDNKERKFEWIADEELRAAILEVAEANPGDADAIAVAAARRLGFARTSAAMLEALRRQMEIAEAEQEQALSRQATQARAAFTGGESESSPASGGTPQPVAHEPERPGGASHVTGRPDGPPHVASRMLEARITLDGRGGVGVVLDISHERIAEWWSDEARPGAAGFRAAQLSESIRATLTAIIEAQKGLFVHGPVAHAALSVSDVSSAIRLGGALVARVVKSSAVIHAGESLPVEYLVGEPLRLPSGANVSLIRMQAILLGALMRSPGAMDYELANAFSREGIELRPTEVARLRDKMGISRFPSQRQGDPETWAGPTLRSIAPTNWLRKLLRGK